MEDGELWEMLIIILVVILIIFLMAMICSHYWFVIKTLRCEESREGSWESHAIETPTHKIYESINIATLDRKTIGEVYADIYSRGKGKRYVVCRRFAQVFVLLRDPELIKRIVLIESANFPSDEAKERAREDTAHGRRQFPPSGIQWLRIQRSLNSCFSRAMLRNIFRLFPKVCDVLRTHVSRGVEAGGGGGWAVELRELCTNFATSAMSSCALGIPCDAVNHPEAELRRMVRLLMGPIPKTIGPWVVSLGIPWEEKLLTIPFVWREVTEFFKRTVSGEVGRRERERIERNDYLQVFMRLWYEGRLSMDGIGGQDGHSGATEGQPINAEDEDSNMDDITIAAMTFFCDGTMNTANLLSVTLFELAHNPEVQEKLREDIAEVLNLHEGIVTFEALHKLPYLDMVVLEVLRLYPTLPFLVRTCAKSYKLPNSEYGRAEEGGLELKQGTPVVVPIYGLHRDNLYYPKSQEFDPSRFSNGAMKGRLSFTYYPYGEGSRMCIGVKFGTLLTKAVIAFLLPLFKFIRHEKTARPITLDPLYSTTVSKGGLWVQMQKI